jgi:hypothetical protein
MISNTSSRTDDVFFGFHREVPKNKEHFSPRGVPQNHVGSSKVIYSMRFVGSYVGSAFFIFRDLSRFVIEYNSNNESNKNPCDR